MLAALRFGGPRYDDDLARMLTEVRPDVVHVTTPAQTHVTLALQVLDADAHVYADRVGIPSWRLKALP